MIGESFAPIDVPAALWERPDVRCALQNRDVGALFKLIQQHTGASQHRLAKTVDMSQGRVNELINRKRELTALTSFERLADGLAMPDTARIALGLAPSQAPDCVTLDDLVEIDATYPTQADAADDMRTLAKESSVIEVMAVRGLGILGLNHSLLRDVIPAAAQLRVALLSPDSAAIEHRAAEIGESAESFEAGIRLSVARIKELATHGRHLELYLYDQMPIWRIIKLDDTLFVSAFTSRHEGHTSPTHRITPNHRGVLHHAFTRTLELIMIDAHRVV